MSRPKPKTRHAETLALKAQIMAACKIKEAEAHAERFAALMQILMTVTEKDDDE